MSGLDTVLLIVIITILGKDVGPKIIGYFNAKKGGVLETPIAPYISKRTRLISHGIFVLVFLILIIHFDALDLLTLVFFISLVIMELIPQPHGVYEKGLRAKGHFYYWENIQKITVPKKTSVFEIKLKRKLLFKVSFSVSSADRETLIKALSGKPVELEVGR
ncbi:hypothetical protein [Isachenkonia alkalipeptolytica]|uniref:DUF5673 domain-containing protein n=1 Tax=Isachenkonia alkalipeptolytica TaxID=2565777 RepID=A0AA43XLC0_9CLOT|nr:hypothetical protein [Isachenkonia alkalipeptolytica]NBG88416.1 hypothetical protein [Isachenkonia alkalipeptolytica]